MGSSGRFNANTPHGFEKLEKERRVLQHSSRSSAQHRVYWYRATAPEPGHSDCDGGGRCEMMNHPP